jgi:hypothetical protein
MGTLLHIGHGKTGSSSIQAFLALNADLLSGLGFSYPDSGERAFANRGWISSGNGSLLMNVSEPVVGNAIYSSEILFRKIPSLPNPKEFLRRIDPTSILVYTRDLHQHSWSSYGQRIKRRKLTLDYLDFIRLQYGKHLDTLLWWIEICSDLEIDLKVWNYSRRKSSLIQDFLHSFLLIQNQDLLSRFQFSSSKVNRSLDPGEMEIQRLFNGYDDAPSPKFLSDRWVNSLPEILPARAPLTVEISSTLESLFTSKIEQINNHISDEERILIWDPEYPKSQLHSVSEPFVFTSDQLAVIVDGIQSYLRGKV